MVGTRPQIGQGARCPCERFTPLLHCLRKCLCVIRIAQPAGRSQSLAVTASHSCTGNRSCPAPCGYLNPRIRAGRYGVVGGGRNREARGVPYAKRARYHGSDGVRHPADPSGSELVRHRVVRRLKRGQIAGTRQGRSDNRQ